MGESVCEYRITVTMPGYGSDEEAAEDLFEAYLQTHPEVGPVVSLHSGDDTIAVTLAVDAVSQQRALDLATEIWRTGKKSSGLALGEPIQTEIERVSGPVTAAA